MGDKFEIIIKQKIGKYNKKDIAIELMYDKENQRFISYKVNGESILKSTAAGNIEHFIASARRINETLSNVYEDICPAMTKLIKIDDVTEE